MTQAQDDAEAIIAAIDAQIVECPCDHCECPELTDEEGPCLACRTGHHEGEE